MWRLAVPAITAGAFLASASPLLPPGAEHGKGDVNARFDPLLELDAAVEVDQMLDLDQLMELDDESIELVLDPSNMNFDDEDNVKEAEVRHLTRSEGSLSVRLHRHNKQHTHRSPDRSTHSINQLMCVHASLGARAGTVRGVGDRENGDQLHPRRQGPQETLLVPVGCPPFVQRRGVYA
jgi:hypothetical protein